MTHEAGPEGDGAGSLPSRLAASIIERARQLGWQGGTHLREQSLADAFKVSRTPVRMALRALEELDLVESRPNRGFFLKAGDAPAPPARGADEDPLYFQIAEDRLSGRIGERQSEAELARRYGAPRARLVRALSRMAEEGWAARRPGHGWEFQPVLTSPASYDQGYRFRMLIEPAALLEPSYRVDEAAFAQARARQRAMLEGGALRWSIAATFAANSELHELLVAGSGNPFLIEGLRRVNRLRRLFEYRLNPHRERLANECREHLHLLDLVEAGKRARAASFLRGHLDRARRAKAAIFAAGG